MFIDVAFIDGILSSAVIQHDVVHASNIAADGQELPDGVLPKLTGLETVEFVML